MRRFAAFALILALVLPTAALAADSTVSVNVTAYITLSGVPSNISFGTTLGGETLTASSFDASVSTNNTAGYTLSAAMTALVDQETGTQSIPASSMTLIVSSTPLPSNGTLATSTAPGSFVTTVTPQLDVAAAQASGSYLGTLTISATAN